MARIYQRKERKGDYNWYVDYMVNGKRCRKKAGPSKKLAQLALADIQVKIQREDIGLGIREIQLEEFCQKYIEHCRAKNSSAQAERVSYVIEIFKGFLKTRYPHVCKISQLSSEMFEEYQTFRIGSKYRKKPIRKKTINLERQSLKTMLKRAVEWGYLRENPCKIKRLKEVDSKKVRSLSEEEVRRILAFDQRHWLYPVLYTMLYTGMRSGECRFLTWDDVDFGNQKILVQSKDGWIPKSSGGEVREREIYIGAELTLFLKKLKIKSAHVQDHWVFHDRYGRQLSRGLSETFAKITKILGFKDVTQIHALRHTYITHLIRAGNDLPTVKEQAGHKNIATTMKYVDVFVDQKRRAANSLTYTAPNLPENRVASSTN